ncbi:MAG: hypothetical protein HUJ68_08605 [Clostridia bacterium]|nr:hypothetical protein [Clostridia bacterium]
MNQGSLKNIVVLKGLPSNVIEEAIVIFKSNKTAKEMQKIEKAKTKTIKTENKDTKTEEYILKEAEMLISNYADNMENSKNEEKLEKYTTIKKYAYISTIMLIIETLIILIK